MTLADACRAWLMKHVGTTDPVKVAKLAQSHLVSPEALARSEAA